MKTFLHFKRLVICCCCPFAAMSGSGGASAAQPDSRFDLEKIAERNPRIASLVPGEGFDREVLRVSPDSAAQRITIWEKGDPGDWSQANYLVIEMYGANDYSGRISIEFYRESGLEGAAQLQSGEVRDTARPRLLSLQGLMPRVPTKMVFPLDYLDAQRIFLPRFPRQLKGTLTGSRMEPEEIAAVRLQFGPYSEPHFTPSFEIASIALHPSLPEPYPPLEEPIVDVLGQWNQRDWPGKIHSEEELIERTRALLESVESASFPQTWSRFGGWKEKQFGATGFFRTHHDGDRWWLVDPDGYAFISAGVTGMGHNALGPVEGIEDFFAWLPEEGDERFAPALGRTRDMRAVDFLRANLIRAFGDDWIEEWSRLTAGLMKRFQLNTVANWSNLEFAREHRLPYVLQMRDFPSTENRLFRDFPDVYSDEYREASVRYASQLEDFKNDPYLIGYFLINEPHWGFGYHNLAFEMFATDAPSATKTAFIEWLEEQYEGRIDSFNREWRLSLSDFAALNVETFREYPSERAEQLFHEFSRVMVKKYVDVACDEVEKVAPDHLNLGMRYAWISSDLMYTAGERFDVFSINGYGNPGPPRTDEIARRSGKPVIIGEWHFGATDRGLPATGIQGALNQEQRAMAYRYYAEQAFARPELVGIHYFQWNDQPVSGRFDGENYNIGVVDITNQPYPELTEAMTISHQRMYHVASGEEPPFDQVIERVPSIHY